MAVLNFVINKQLFIHLIDGIVHLNIRPHVTM